jgi:antitoxin component YwqK of YwqJK toxin-antitoxin module
MILKVSKTAIIFIALLFCYAADAQYKTYTLSVNGDTLNAIDNKGLKQGKWVIHVDELRGEPGYEEEGIFVDGKREGTWRRYNLNSDLMAIENYRYGGKDGLSQYFTPLGELVREENWRAYNPDAPYDTIPVYGTGSNEILSYKIVKAEQYSVKNGDWTYYDPATGRIQKLEKYDRGHLLEEPKTDVVTDQPKKIAKPVEVLEYEKKNSGKKKVKVRDGQTR